MSFIDNIVQDWPWPLKVNAFFAILFFFLVAITILSLVFLRVYKNRRERNKRHYWDQIDTFLNNGLFDDTFDLAKETQRFKASHLVTPLQKKVAIREILVYNENLKGESSEILKNLFHDLGLDEFTISSLTDGKWYDKAKAIYVLSELQVKKAKTVALYLNDKHETVRAQAIYYYIKTADKNPLGFFGKLKKELTLWELIQLEDCLKFVYQGPVPDFSKWLDHQLNTVLVFSIRMIQQFDQYEHMERLVPFLDHQDERVRAEAIKSLRKLHFEGLLDVVVPRFLTESRLVKKEIIKTVETHGDLELLRGLRPALSIKEEWQTNLMYLRAEKRMQPTLES
ncbi:HEAT repeat domain-containing protein [Flagellimonas amoyensis]|uniref:HEAT repeat domain-containing protein n=1 Tax=Flagellimonas amoyensis TaxID=2169401 RepID=UPI000D3C8900|nr:HEAT repeat domain-containing protein [Allomuricauda amoyensis]